jgi:hypothetical protein
MTRSQAALVPPGPAANWRQVADAAPALARAEAKARELGLIGAGEPGAGHE